MFPTKLVEKTGAGDAYAAAFIAALNRNLNLGEAMVWGTINSAHVIREVGAQNGLLNLDGVERYRKSVPNLIATSL